MAATSYGHSWVLYGPLLISSRSVRLSLAAIDDDDDGDGTIIGELRFGHFGGIDIAYSL